MNAIFNVVVRETSGPGCLLHFSFFFFFFSLIKKFFLIVFKILVALVFLAVHCLSLVAMSRVYSVLAAHGFLIVAEQGL